MAGPPVPPSAQPEPTEDRPDEAYELTPEEARERRQNRWLVILTVLALLAVGGAAYAISQAEDAKDDNREGGQRVAGLAADVGVAREQLQELEGQVENAADADTLDRLQQDLDALDRKVNRLEQQADEGAGPDEQLTNRVDDLEQRVEDLEDESN